MKKQSQRSLLRLLGGEIKQLDSFGQKETHEEGIDGDSLQACNSNATGRPEIQQLLGRFGALDRAASKSLCVLWRGKSRLVAVDMLTMLYNFVPGC